MEAPAPVLVIEHELDCPPAWLGEWLVADGLTLDVRRPYAGDRLPDTLKPYGALLVLGGAMGANDDATHPWLTGTKALLRVAVETRLPTLGVCLGHQLACVALGGVAGINPRGRQMGLFDLGWTAAAVADPVFGAVVGDVVAVQWNNDIVLDLPSGAQVLAATADGVSQVVRLGPAAWSVQFHPEVGSEIFRLWADTDRDESALLGIDVDEVGQAICVADPHLRTTWAKMAHAFAEVVTMAPR